MPAKKIKTPIIPGFVYHIYNRGNNYQDVFLSKEDYILFLDKIKYYLLDYCHLYAFALLPNHYHLLIRIKEDIERNSFSQQFAKLILCYTNRTNKKYNRDGNLFLKIFKRIRIDNEDYLKHLVFYINHNPVKHEIADIMKNYNYSSYNIFLSGKPTDLDRDKVFSYFGSRDEFASYHKYLHDETIIKKLTFEEV